VRPGVLNVYVKQHFEVGISTRGLSISISGLSVALSLAASTCNWGRLPGGQISINRSIEHLINDANVQHDINYDAYREQR
jgi:hypothetical protein